VARFTEIRPLNKHCVTRNTCQRTDGRTHGQPDERPPNRMPLTAIIGQGVIR